MDLPFNSREILGEVLNARLCFRLCKGEEILNPFRECLGRTSRASLAESAALDGGHIEGGFKGDLYRFLTAMTALHGTQHGQVCKM